MPTVMKGNKREIPGNMPPLLWYEKVQEYMAAPELRADLAYFHPVMELLPPEDLLRLKAQVLIWYDVTDRYPDDISVWWPVRMARRRGDIPHTEEVTEAWIGEDGVLHCGFCKARWSPHHDGSPHADRCGLCDRVFHITKEVPA